MEGFKILCIFVTMNCPRWFNLILLKRKTTYDSTNITKYSIGF